MTGFAGRAPLPALSDTQQWLGTPLWMWLTFVGVVATLLALDLGVFHRETRVLLGVHILGANATELVHIGQAVIRLNGGLDFFLSNVFNYPTYAECYRVAALNAYNNMRASAGE